MTVPATDHICNHWPDLAGGKPPTRATKQPYKWRSSGSGALFS